MNRGVRIVLLLGLAVTCWRVYSVRSRLSSEDADPAAVQEMKQRLAALPEHIEGTAYVGQPYEINEKVVRDAGADSFASKLYTDANGRGYRIYIGGSIRNKENFHAPGYCMPAQGWDIIEQTVVPLAARPLGDVDATMRRLLIQRGSERMLVYYWFQAGGRTANHEFMIRLYRFFDLFWGAPLRPTLIITLYVPVRGQTVDATEKRSITFLEALGPALHEAFTAELPDEATIGTAD